MNTPRLLLRSLLTVLCVGLFASTHLQSQVMDLGPATGDGESEERAPGSRGLYSITDDPDPFGRRYGGYPRNDSYVVWGAAGTRVSYDGTTARPRPLPIVLVVDTATGAVVALDVGTGPGGSLSPGSVSVGADGYTRITLSARVPRRR